MPLKQPRELDTLEDLKILFYKLITGRYEFKKPSTKIKILKKGNETAFQAVSKCILKNYTVLDDYLTKSNNFGYCVFFAPPIINNCLSVAAFCNDEYLYIPPKPIELNEILSSVITADRSLEVFNKECKKVVADPLKYGYNVIYLNCITNKKYIPCGGSYKLLEDFLKDNPEYKVYDDYDQWHSIAHTARMEKQAREIESVDEDRYWDILECLPPFKFSKNYVVCGEPYSNEYHTWIIKVEDQWYEKLDKKSATPAEVEQRVLEGLKNGI